MNRRNILNLSGITALGFAMLPTGAIAQTKSIKEQIAGAWILVSNVNTAKDGKKSEPWGANPKGTLVFDGNGHFAQILLRSDLPRIAGREAGTPEQDRAIARGQLSLYGTYSVDEAAKVINTRNEASTFAAFNGTDGKRFIVELTADELKTRNPATTEGGTAESTWRRAK